MKVLLISDAMTSFSADSHSTTWPFAKALLITIANGREYLGHPCSNPEHPFHLRPQGTYLVISRADLAPEISLDAMLQVAIEAHDERFFAGNGPKLGTGGEIGSEQKSRKGLEQTFKSWWTQILRDSQPVTS